MTVTREVILQQTVTSVYVVLIEINHNLLEDPIRVVNDEQDLTALGYLWKRGYCGIKLPSTLEGERSASITIQNVDNRIGLAAQSLVGPATVKFRVVRRDAADPANDIEVEYPTLRINSIQGDAMAIQGNIISNHDKGEPFPAVSAHKDVTPGLFL